MTRHINLLCRADMTPWRHRCRATETTGVHFGTSARH